MPTGKSSRVERMSSLETGAMVAMASFGMLFGTLLLSYGLARLRAPVWPPIGAEPINPWLPTLSVIAVLLSSYTVQEAVSRWQQGKHSEFSTWWQRTLWLGLAFLAVQTGVWLQLYRMGQTLTGNLFSAIYWVLTCVHALHVIAAITALCWVFLRLRKKNQTLQITQAPKIAAWFWHFLGAVWVLMYVALVWI
jgi:cytochrome c oxidase subunit 3